MSRVFALFHFCHYVVVFLKILINIKNVNISLILVFKVVKTSVNSENGKRTGHSRYINSQNKFVRDFSLPQKKHALQLRRHK